MRNWVISITEEERMELERIVIDGDAPAALDFLEKVIRKRMNESLKKSGCYQDASKPVGDISRPIAKHKRLGSAS
ncbi:MAG: hypothetical protein WHT46_06240 [Candidatus Geothermincolales bacterium]